jgi:hypothetical protein
MPPQMLACRVSHHSQGIPCDQRACSGKPFSPFFLLLLAFAPFSSCVPPLPRSSLPFEGILWETFVPVHLCSFLKGEQIMTLLPFTDCCLLLGVDPKTLRRWLQSANLSFSLHPIDARLKCLTPSQLQHLASLHGRPLPDPLPTLAPVQSSEATIERDLQRLHASVAALQAQVTELTLALLRQSGRHEAAQLPASPPPSPAPDLPPVKTDRPSTSAPVPAPDESLPPPSRSRSRALPLIQYGADGNYLAICPQSGILPLVLDSPEWFDWLSSLTHFTFQGANGHFSASRKFRQGQRIQAWNAHRSLRGRSCYLYLGQTDHLTVAHLEHMATTVYERLTSV